MAFTKLVNALWATSECESSLGYLKGRDDACSAEAQFMEDIYKIKETVWLVSKGECECWTKLSGFIVSPSTDLYAPPPLLPPIFGPSWNPHF
jgi:hypothetical protein